jgi:putative transposase
MTLNRLKVERGVPKVLFCDNAVSSPVRRWTYNAYVESFNGTFRSECLDTHWFADLKEAKQLIEVWRQEYNESRPHRSLGDRRLASSPVSTRLAAYSLQPKPAED